MLSELLRSIGRIRPPARRSPPQPSAKRSASAKAAPRFNQKLQWWSDPAWNTRFERHVLADGFGGRHPHRILDRRFMLTELAKAAQSLSGSTAECGVYRGVGSALICEALRHTYRDVDRHFGFDSFSGLPPTGPSDANWRQGDLHERIDTAARHLAEFRFVELVPGWLPDTLVRAAEHRFRFVHIDVDLERTTWDCLAYFYARAISGAVFVFDDYGFKSCPGARRTVDAFLSDKPEPLIELTTGQAVFFKD
jgi:O-methyltransferase